MVLEPFVYIWKGYLKYFPYRKLISLKIMNGGHHEELNGAGEGFSHFTIVKESREHMTYPQESGDHNYQSSVCTKTFPQCVHTTS